VWCGGMGDECKGGMQISNKECRSRNAEVLGVV
jgi:hypothetical protein